MKRVEIEQLLPGIFQRTARPGSPLAALLETMEAMHEPPERVLAGLEALFHPHRTRDEFVPMLARWLDLAHLLDSPGGDKLPARAETTISTGLGRLRDLVATAAQQAQWTGTARGMKALLQAATGESSFDVLENLDADNRPRPFHLTVQAPAALASHRDLIERIIAAEKPAYTTSDLVFKP